LGRRSLFHLMLLCPILLSPPVCAQTQPADPLEQLEPEIDKAAGAMRDRNEREARSARLSGLAIEAFGGGEYLEAERLLLEQRQIDPENFVVHYNLACARAVLGRTDDANADLRRAVELGFANRGHLERDPYLEPLRETPAFKKLLDHWGGVIDMQRRVRREHVLGWVKGKTVVRADEDLRIDIVSSHDEHETDAALAEIRKVAQWAEVFFPEAGEDAAPPFVVVALPGKRDFLKWAFWTYGEMARRAFAGIGGAYEHDLKRLVAQDLGPTLRHEFFHVLHWRDMDRLGQVHPIWIQEGLASLVEDIDPARIINRKRVQTNPSIPRGVDPNLIPRKTPAEDQGEDFDEPMNQGGYEPVPSWRTNIVKRLARSGPLPGFEEFAAKSHQTFSTKRPLAAYANARTMFLLLHERGVLGEWYRLYTTDPDVGYDTDRSGIAAIEAALGSELPAIEDAYRAWVRGALPLVAETGAQLDAVLGIDIEQTEGAGPMVTRVPREARLRTGLRRLDVITAIDGRPVRDMKELIRVLSAYGVGETVRVEYTRVKLRGARDIRLVERG